MDRPCPEVSNINNTYVCIMLLETDLLTLSMGMGSKLPPFVNPKCG